MVWTCLPFVKSGQNHLPRHSKREKKIRQTEEEVRRVRQRMDRPGVENGEKWRTERKMEETGCEVIRGAPTTVTVKR